MVLRSHWHDIKRVNVLIPGVTVAAAAPMSLQRWENEGNSYLVSFPLLTKIPKEIKREFYSYMICEPGTQPSVWTENMFRDEKGKNEAYFKSPKLSKRWVARGDKTTNLHHSFWIGGGNWTFNGRLTQWSNKWNCEMRTVSSRRLGICQCPGETEGSYDLN